MKPRPENQRHTPSPASASTVLDPMSIDLLAELIAAKLEAHTAARLAWVGADVVAVHLGVNVQWVYDHGYELGGVRLGDGTTQGRWRFKLERVDELLERSVRSSAPPASETRRQRAAGRKVRGRRRALRGSGIELLPVRDRNVSDS